MVLLLQDKHVAAHFSGGAGGLHTGSTGTHHNHVAVLLHLQLLVYVALRHSGVDGAADGTVDTDAVSGAAHVAGDALAQHVLFPVLHLVDPLGVSNEATAHAHDVHVAAFQHLLHHGGVPVVASIDDGLAELLLHGTGLVSTPAIRQEVGVDLILQRGIQAAGHVVDVHELVQVFQILQSVLQGVATRHPLLGGHTDDDGEPGPHLAAHFLQHHAGEAETVLHGAAELIGSLVVVGGDELAHEVGVTAVDLHGVKADGLHTLGRLSVLFHRVEDLLTSHGTGHLSSHLGGNVGGGHRLHPSSGRRSGRACMVDLDGHGGPVLVQVLHQLIVPGHEAVVIDADLAGAVGAHGVLHIGVLQNDQANAALCAQGIVIHVTVTHFTAGLAIVGAHGSHRNAVANGHPLHRDRFKDFWIVCFHESSPRLFFAQGVSSVCDTLIIVFSTNKSKYIFRASSMHSSYQSI